MLLTAAALLEANPAPTREEIRDQLSGNFCRCTGYQAIIDAVADAAEAGE
jgi:carbon-monoxide dehydrogenase small subunit